MQPTLTMSFCRYALPWAAYTYIVVVYTRMTTIELCSTIAVAPTSHSTTASALSAMRDMAQQADRCDGPRWAMWHQPQNTNQSSSVLSHAQRPLSAKKQQRSGPSPAGRASSSLATANGAAVRAVRAVYGMSPVHACHVTEIFVDNCTSHGPEKIVWNNLQCHVSKMRLPPNNLTLPIHDIANETGLFMFVACHERAIMDTLRNVSFHQIPNVRACLVKDFPQVPALMIRKGLCQADRADGWTMWVNDFELKRLLCAGNNLRYPP